MGNRDTTTGIAPGCAERSESMNGRRQNLLNGRTALLLAGDRSDLCGGSGRNTGEKHAWVDTYCGCGLVGCIVFCKLYMAVRRTG